MNDALVRVEKVEKKFNRGSEVTRVLDHLDLEIARGEFLAMMGPSGSGKSTLLNLIGGLDRPTAGSVSIGGERIDQYSDRQLATWRARHVGLVFQFYNLMPHSECRPQCRAPPAADPSVQETASTARRGSAFHRRP